MVWQLAAILILMTFYSIYIGKMLVQKKKGIQTDQIARGKQKGKIFYIELAMKISTYGVVVVEVISIVLKTSIFPANIRVMGIVLGICGNILFALAVWTMRDSWRAGISENEKTELITTGIYSISRNPAFLGFYFVYLGILFVFFNWFLLIFSCFAAALLHLQVLQEEAFLPSVFGSSYMDYSNMVRRYMGRK